MKIIHVLNHFLPDHIAGTEVYGFNLGKELFRKGNEIIFIIPNYHQTKNEEYQVEGLRVIKYAEPSVVNRALKMGKQKPAGLKNFVEVLREEKPDIVHFHELAGSNGIGSYHVKAAKELGFKVVMTFHLARYTAIDPSGNDFDDIFYNKRGSLNFYRQKEMGSVSSKIFYSFGSVLKFLGIDTSALGKAGTALSIPFLVAKRKDFFLTLMKSCDAVVAISKWYFEVLDKLPVPQHKLHFVEQGIELRKSSNTQQINNIGKLNLVFVGRISHFKGVINLVETINGMKDVRLDLYGDSGEDKSYIDKCIQLITASSGIDYKGALNPHEVIQIISQYDILILPSTIHEMSPLVIREAFAAGIPVLASDSMGAKEQITDGVNGWLFKMNDWGDLKKKLEWLISHPEAIAEAKKHLPPVRTFTEVAQDYEVLYHEIMQKN